MPPENSNTSNAFKKQSDAWKEVEKYRNEKAPRKQGEDIGNYYDRVAQELKNDAQHKALLDKYTELNKQYNQVSDRAGEKFKSSHFDEPNILVHLRMNTRTDAEGNKVLFLEEIQSDWGQKGKKEGFVNDPEFKKAQKEYSDIWNELFDGKTGQYKTTLSKSEIEILNKKRTEASDKLDKYGTHNIPEAPFVTDTNAWTKLALKVALKESVKQSEVLQRNAWEKMMSEKEEWIEARMKKLGKLRIECP